MKRLLLTVLAFGLLSSSAFAEEQPRQEGLEKSSLLVSLLLEQTSGSAFSTHSTLIAPPAAILISVSPNSQNTARPRLQLQPISPPTQKKASALGATSTRFAAYKSIISRLRNTSAAMN
jgi:hypothetical protein